VSQPSSTNGAAITSLVLGIVAVLAAVTVILAFVSFVPGIGAIVAGVIALRRPDGSGRASAIAGLVSGILATAASVLAFAIVALFVASSDETLSHNVAAAPDDYRLSDRTCEVDGGEAVASGVLTNTSGAAHGFEIEVTFSDRGDEFAMSHDDLDHRLADGASWNWEVRLSTERDVNTDGLACRVTSVELDLVVAD
jgi:hypothetical protein